MQKIKNVFGAIKAKFTNAKTEATAVAESIVEGTEGEMYVDTAVKILIAVVIGALVLVILYAVFNETVRERLSSWIEELFGRGDTLVGSLD